MRPLRAVFALAGADFLERVRRYSFLLTMLFAGYLGYSAATGGIVLRLEGYRGVYTAAWIGTMVAVVTTCFVSLIGFYIVKNAVERDRATGVGEILATTPLSRSAYMLGKLLSNFTVLAAVVLILALGSVAMYFLAAEAPPFDLWALLSPFLLLALPAMAAIAAMALLFESIPLLRGGFGNVAWFFVWGTGLGVPLAMDLEWLDLTGMGTVMHALTPAARAAIPGYQKGISLTINVEGMVKVAPGLRWEGIEWTLPGLLARLLWIGFAVGVTLLASLLFDRFDPSRGSGKLRFRRGAPGRDAEPVSPARRVASPAPAPHLTPLTPGRPSHGFLRIFEAELRLALQGFRWWWYLGVAGLLVPQFFVPLEVARGPLLGAAWLWPTLVWSSMGCREIRFGTGPILFSCARILPRQLPATYLAGVAVAVACGAGAGIRLLAAGRAVDFAAWIAGALFVPALALALGVVARSGKFFEGLYTVLWYIGPMNHTPGLDFTGASGGPRTWSITAVYLLLTAGLLAAALLGRRRQLRHA